MSNPPVQLHTDNYYHREAMVRLLRDEGIDIDSNLDYSCGIFDDDELIATGSFCGNTLRCLAVRSDRRGEGLLAVILSHLVQIQVDRGATHLFIYTKSENAETFRSLGFSKVAEAKCGIVLLENKADAFGTFCRKLKDAEGEKKAAIVMNANPFTKGHRHLAEQAARENDVVHVFVLEEDASVFPADVRWQHVREGLKDLENVIVHKSGSYIISHATFPSYFLKGAESGVKSQAMLDAAVFSKIAARLGIKTRYVGREIKGSVTDTYNEALKETLPEFGIACVEIPRLCCGGTEVSAGTVRELIRKGDAGRARELVPESTWAYLCSEKAEPVIRKIREQ